MTIRSWDEMTVDVYGHLDGVVSKLGLDILGGLPLLEQEACISVPQIMETDPPDPCLLQALVEDPLPQVVFVQLSP